jgi:hypothetical protein
VETANTDNQSAASSEDAGDLVWGAAAIGHVIGRSRQQVYHLHEIGALDGCVVKLGWKTFVGSRKRLKNLYATKQKA